MSSRLIPPKTGAILVINILKKLQRDGHTVIIITHNREIARHCADRIITMDKGHVISDTRGS